VSFLNSGIFAVVSSVKAAENKSNSGSNHSCPDVFIHFSLLKPFSAREIIFSFACKKSWCWSHFMGYFLGPKALGLLCLGQQAALSSPAPAAASGCSLSPWCMLVLSLPNAVDRVERMLSFSRTSRQRSNMGEHMIKHGDFNITYGFHQHGGRSKTMDILPSNIRK